MNSLRCSGVEECPHVAAAVTVALPRHTVDPHHCSGGSAGLHWIMCGCHKTSDLYRAGGSSESGNDKALPSDRAITQRKHQMEPWAMLKGCQLGKSLPQLIGPRPGATSVPVVPSLEQDGSRLPHATTPNGPTPRSAHICQRTHRHAKEFPR